MSRKDLIKYCIEKTIKERNAKIDEINEKQRVLNARRAGIWAQYQVKLDELQAELDTIDGRGSEIPRPQKNFEQNGLTL